MHSCIYVFHKAEDAVEDLISKYDENIEMNPPVLAFTKEQAIAKVRRDLENYKNSSAYKEYMANPEKYCEEHKDCPAHLEYLKTGYNKQLKWTDEECYWKVRRFYDDDMVKENGDLMTTYNPLSKWDWWEYGGRYAGIIETGKALKEYKGKIEVPFGVVLPDGTWIERYDKDNGNYDETEEEWKKRFHEILKTIDGEMILDQIDVHV